MILADLAVLTKNTNVEVFERDDDDDDILLGNLKEIDFVASNMKRRVIDIVSSFDFKNQVPVMHIVVDKNMER